MSVRDLLTKSHSYNDDLFKVSLGTSEPLVEKGLKALVHVTSIAKELSHLFKRARNIA
jgi:hypothetical protein